MEVGKHSPNNRPGIGFRLFKAYVRFSHGKIFYKKTYWIGTEHIPDKGALMIVSNHQNGLSDVLGILLSIKNRKRRKVRVVSRADIFNTPFGKQLRWLGIIPAYRLEFEGEEAMARNDNLFHEIEQELLLDGTVVIYPEAGHQDKRWLGPFSLAYLRMLFEAARKTDFTKEMFVLPSCNHYSHYFHAREKMLVRYGTPISIAPYYELYKTKPRTAQRQVNQLVRQQISSMMLNIDDLEHYSSIDFIRDTYGKDFARRKGYNVDELPQKLEADKLLVKLLDTAKATYESDAAALYAQVDSYRQQMKTLRVRDENFRHPVGLLQLIGKGLLFALLLPLFVVSCVPNLLIYYAPRLATRKIEDPMLHSGFDLAVSVLVTAPVLYLLTCGVVWATTQSLLGALLCLLFLPFGGLFMYYYMKKFKTYKTQLRFFRLRRKGMLDGLAKQRDGIYKTIDNLLTRIDS